ncbi:MAG: hypothetical protein IKV62_04320 [Bacteroidales bacterium]|nr:hypothetical protein [Bacteroidales bacterium]
MKLDNKSLWNEAGRVGFVFGGFSALCLLLREGAALTKSSFLIQAAAIILWAVEFFGCILLMKKYMLDLRDKFDGVTVIDTYRFGRRVALLSGMILAAVTAILVMNTPEETIASLIEQVNTSFASLGSISDDEKARLGDKLPLYTFIGRWIYCFLYGSLLSSIMSRYIFAQDMFRQDGGNQEDDNVDNQ